MSNPVINLKCPQCGYQYVIPVSQAIQPLIDQQVEQRLGVERATIIAQARDAATKESDERNRLLIAQQGKVIADLRLRIDEMRRRADQGSQQSQGEIMELQLESLLKASFPSDQIAAVGKGVRGGDIIHRVVNLSGTPVGSILYESKNAKAWASDWIPKVKADMRECGAAISVIVAATLPSNVQTFARVDGVFVTSTKFIAPLAAILRQVLLDIAVIRATSKGDEQKLMAYITGQRFCHRVAAVIEAAAQMQADLDLDKRSVQKRWAKGQKHIDTVLSNMSGLFGDLEALVGAMPHVEGLGGNAEARQAS